MSLGTIAPWLQLPNFQAAAEAGARIGQQQRQAADEIALGRERNAQAAQEAAGRLSLGFTEAATAAQKAKADQELAKAAMALHQGRYSDLNQQAKDKLELGRDRFNGLEDNRDVVNGLHQDQLDSLNDHRAEVDALRAARLPGGGTGGGGVPGEKPHMVDITLPGINGGKDRHVSLPSTDPRAKEFLDQVFEIPVDTTRDLDAAASGKGQWPDALYSGGAGGETLPLPGQAVPGQPIELRPRNQIYTGEIGGEPPQDQNPSNIYTGPAAGPAISEPGPLPPEELPGPAALPGGKALTPDVASGYLKQTKGDKDAARKLARAAGYTF